MSSRRCPRCGHILSRTDTACPQCNRTFSIIDTQEIKITEDSEIRYIPVNCLRVLPEVQFRVKLDPQTVEDYARIYRKPVSEYAERSVDRLPPVLVVADGENDFIVADGFHRVAAAKSISEVQPIPVTMMTPFLSHSAIDTAIYVACKNNRTFGVQRTAEDKAKAVAMYLSLPGNADTPDSALAEELNIYKDDIIQKGKELYKEWHASKSVKKPEGRSAEELAVALHKTHIQFMDDLRALVETYTALSDEIIRKGMKQ